MNENKSILGNKSLILLLLVTSFGYFIDAGDLVLFSLLRSGSIQDLGLGVKGTVENTNVGLALESSQSWGILIGGISWGIIGDKFGRLKALYGSIALYSTATLINGFLTSNWGDTFSIYKTLRFISGFGLAGEFGIGATLVLEAMKKETRGYGSMIMASFGILGCVAAAALTKYSGLHWSSLFKIGGFAGLAILIFRIGVTESSVFLKSVQSVNVQRGNFFSLFSNWSRLKRFLICILIGLPTYYAVSLPIKFADNFGTGLGISDINRSLIPVAMITFYLALSFSDVICNSVSQWIKSRKKMFIAYNVLNLIVILYFFINPPSSSWEYLYVFCPLLGFFVGYWALIVTTTAESFGTNLRATATASVPNILRSTFIPIAALYKILAGPSQTYAVSASAYIGIGCAVIAIIASFFLKETFSRDLNFEEK